MPRIRTIKPDFFHDECLADLPLKQRMTFVGLWLYADREGRLEDRPKYLKSQIWPYEQCDIEQILDNLNGKFIQRYQIEGRAYIQIVNFLKHQKPHHTEKESLIPECDNSALTVKEPLKNGEAPVGREGKGRERKGTVYSVDFEQFWKRYPRKVNKKKAHDAWIKFNSDLPPIEDILKSVDAHINSTQWTNKRYIPHPTTWLNGHGWLDEVDDKEEIPF